MHHVIEKLLVGTAALALTVSHADARDFSARLNGFEELGAINAQTGAILSDGKGTLKLSLDKQAGTITYTLTYSNVGTKAPGTGPVTQAHIHFGKARDSGGIMVFLCTNLGNGPAGTPTCPTTSGTVTGTITAAQVLAIATQNVTAGDFDALEDALTSDTAYVNVHTTAHPAGEIRGQIGPGDEGEGNDQ